MFEFEFPEDLDTLKDKKRNEIIMGNREVNYPDILPQEQPPTHLSLSCNSRVSMATPPLIGCLSNTVAMATVT